MKNQVAKSVYNSLSPRLTVLCNAHEGSTAPLSGSAPPQVVRVGSRSSELAMIQTRTIVAALQALYPDIKFEITTMKTIGDKILDKALPKIGQTNLFTKELEVALAANEIDMITHSLKDLPTTLPDGMTISVIYKRDNPTDALVLHPKHKGLAIESLPSGSVIGTSSLRRIAQLKKNFPSLVYRDVRGNLNTRLRKLDQGDGGIHYDALVLATAGLERMKWNERISQELDPSKCMYAVGQGALAVETRADDARINELLRPLNDADTFVVCTAERAFLRTLGGGCSVPVGVHSSLVPSTGKLCMTGAVFSLDGSEVVKNELEVDLPTEYAQRSPGDWTTFADRFGCDLAESLLAHGAGPILEKAKEEMEKSTSK